MSLLTNIEQDLYSSKAESDMLLLSALHSLYFAIQAKIYRRAGLALDNTKVIEIIKKQLRIANHLLEEYQQVGRSDLANEEKKRISILSSYLPDPPSDAEIKEKIIQVIKTINPVGVAEIGKIMGSVMKDFKDKNIDGAHVSKLVENTLSQQQATHK
ncbi:MAG: GatB/YqeY domain-containing protein [Spirochaetota bacterium]